MKFKNSLLLMLVISLTVLLSISMVSAQDNITGDDISFDDTLSVDNSPDELSAGNTIYISPEGTGTGSNEKDPSNWNSAISSAKSGDTIQFLNGTYTNIKGTVYQSVELKGSGNTVLDAQNNGGFITIGDRYSKDITVTLTDLSFVNAYTGEKNGTPDGPKTGFDGEGAIVNGGKLIVKNCYFASNQGIGTEGGAIHNAGTCYVYDSTFFRDGGKKGGAIYSDKGTSLYVYNSLFNKCVSREGCAVHAKEAYVEIHNSSVVNASAKNGLFAVKKSQIYFYDCYFFNSKAVDAAAVINIDKSSTVEIDNCIFDRLSATGTKLWFHQENGTGNGGAIVVEKEGNNVLIKNSIFTNCSAKGEGGAIYIQSSSTVTIDNCTFLDNKAGESGRHIYCFSPVAKVTVTNSKFSAESTIKTSDIAKGETENVLITIDEGTENVLTPQVNVLLNAQKTSQNVGESGSVSFSNLDEGNYILELDVNDLKNTNNYVFSQKSANFTVGSSSDNKTSPKNESENQSDILTLTKIDIVLYDADSGITGLVSDFNGNAVADVTVKYGGAGKYDTVKTDSEGKFAVPIIENKLYDIIFEGNDKYSSSNTTFYLEGVNTNVRVASKFNITNGYVFEAYAVDYKAGERGALFKIILSDDKNSPISGQLVQFGINGNVHNKTTDENGVAVLQINLMAANEYTCAPCYLGNSSYEATFAAAKIVVVKKPITIDAKAKSFKSTVKTKKYTVNLKTIAGSSADGKVYLSAGKKVTLKINGKTYSAKINAQGKATFNIKLTKKGKYNAVIKYAGDKTYNSASKTVKITIK